MSRQEVSEMINNLVRHKKINEEAVQLAKERNRKMQTPNDGKEVTIDETDANGEPLKFKCYRGVLFRHPEVVVKQKQFLCFESLSKDHKSANLVDCWNLSLGLTKQTTQLTEGIPTAAAYFASLLQADSKLLQE